MYICAKLVNNNSLTINFKMRFTVQQSLKPFLYRLTFVTPAWSFVFSSPPQRPMTPDFEGFLSQIFLLHIIVLTILILEKKPVFAFSMLSAKQGNYWYHF